MNSNARALKLMDQIAAATGLTDVAKNSLIQLVNPFADFEMTKTGYFDTDESSSVVQCVKFSRVISAPASAAGGNWDCNIFSLPIANVTGINCKFANYCAGKLLSNSIPSSGINIGGVTVITGPAGAALSITDAVLAAAGTIPCSATGLAPTVDQAGVVDGFLDGQARVVAMGFEVHNTTAVINQQGAVAVYKLPQNHYLDRLGVDLYRVVGGSVTAPVLGGLDWMGSQTLQRLEDVPSTLAQVLLLNGTRQWEAKDGCMIVPTLNDMNIPVQRMGCITPFVQNAKNTTTLTAVAPGALVRAGVTGTAVWGSPNFVQPAVTDGGLLKLHGLQEKNHASNFNTGGAFFTGLSPTTTLVVNTIFYIERFPTQLDTDLVVLANPSPPFSSVAMNLYPEMLRHLPVGVKVADNADGDWFFEAVKSVSNAVSPFLKAILPGPMGTGATIFANAASTWADTKLKERNKKPEAQPNRQLVVTSSKEPPVQQRAQLARPKGYPKAQWQFLTPKQQKAVLAQARRGGNVIPQKTTGPKWTQASGGITGV